MEGRKKRRGWKEKWKEKEGRSGKMREEWKGEGLSQQVTNQKQVPIVSDWENGHTQCHSPSKPHWHTQSHLQTQSLNKEKLNTQLSIRRMHNQLKYWSSTTPHLPQTRSLLLSAAFHRTSLPRRQPPLSHAAAPECSWPPATEHRAPISSVFAPYPALVCAGMALW